MSKTDEPAIGIPYTPNFHSPPMQLQFDHHHQEYYCVAENPYQAGLIPTHAVFDDPKAIPIQQTIYRDTPAPFNCVFCGNSGLTTVRSKPSLAALVGCMMPMMLGVCFLYPSMDCLWHKYHYCPSCKEKVFDFEKSDPCAVMDLSHWTQPSFALP
ncbi:GSH-induced LITAF domain protein-like [Diospyros lotus]|uniref:GSH-induced LITAF domain protein-like n=1 Tax=Diospyros lotus TaxID=55363 RepID=UPI00225731BD|nr:GSH-induced LITAF domain protein-like [Diospyros lotus]